MSLHAIGAAIKRVPPKKFIAFHGAVHGDRLKKKKPAAKKK